LLKSVKVVQRIDSRTAREDQVDARDKSKFTRVFGSLFFRDSRLVEDSTVVKPALLGMPWKPARIQLSNDSDFSPRSCVIPACTRFSTTETEVGFLLLLVSSEQGVRRPVSRGMSRQSYLVVIVPLAMGQPNG
jgi:hypothetical protein